MNELMTKEAAVMAAERTIEVVTSEIVRLQNNLAMVTVATGIEVGRRLVEAKAMVKHGEWGEYIEKNLPFSQTWATRYMRLYNAYGSKQVSLFDDDLTVNFAALQNMSVTNALALLALPEGEREEFIEAHDVTEMSTRELEKAIRERDEARKAAEEANARAEKAGADLEAAEAMIDELEHRPVEVAVEKESAEELQKRVDAEVKKAVKNIKDGYALKEKTANEKIKKLSDDLEKAKAEAEEAAKEMKALPDISELREKLAAAERERDELKKRQIMSNADVARFEVLFDGAQTAMASVLDSLEKQSDKKVRGSLYNAVVALMDKWDERLDGIAGKKETEE